MHVLGLNIAKPLAHLDIGWYIYIVERYACYDYSYIISRNRLSEARVFTEVETSGKGHYENNSGKCLSFENNTLWR